MSQCSRATSTPNSLIAAAPMPPTIASSCGATASSARAIRSSLSRCGSMPYASSTAIAAAHSCTRTSGAGAVSRLATSASITSPWEIHATGRTGHNSSTISAIRSRRPNSATTGSAFAVGTALAGGPPHRSQRALLAHWAPTSGTGVESDVRPGMRDAGGREPPCFESAHPLPGHPVALAAAPKRPVPVPRDLFAECRHGLDVAGDRVVGGVSAHHAAQPLSLLWDGPVPALHEQGVHLAQLGRHFLRDRLAPQREPSRSRLPAHVREAEERERLGPAEAPPSAVLGGEPPELDQAGLLGIQLQVEQGKTLHQVRLEPLGVGTILKTDNDVVGETHDDHITVSLPVPPVPGPQIKDVVQVDVGEQGGCAGPLRGSLLACRPRSDARRTCGATRGRWRRRSHGCPRRVSSSHSSSRSRPPAHRVRRGACAPAGTRRRSRGSPPRKWRSVPRPPPAGRSCPPGW